MKKLLLATMALFLVATPCFAQRVDGISIGAASVTPTGLTSDSLSDWLGEGNLFPKTTYAPGGTIAFNKTYNLVTKNYCDNTSGCWAMDGSAGEADIATGNLFSLDASGTVGSATSTNVTDFTGYRRLFGEGTLSKDVEGSVLDATGTALSIVGRINFTGTLAGTNRRYLVSKYSTGDNQRQYALTTTDNEAGGYYVLGTLMSSSGTSGTAIDSTTHLSPNTEYCVGMVYNGTDVRFYIDGELEAGPTSRTSSFYDGTAPLLIGDKVAGSSSTRFAGYIDELMVTTQTLLAGDVKSICDNGINGNRGGSAVADIFTLPSSPLNKSHCFTQSIANISPITIKPQSTHFMSAQDGTVRCGVGKGLISSGAAGDSICVVGTDSKNWSVFGGAAGAWSCEE